MVADTFLPLSMILSLSNPVIIGVPSIMTNNYNVSTYYYTIGVCDVLTMGLDSTLSSGNFFLYSCCILARYVFKTPERPGARRATQLSQL